MGEVEVKLADEEATAALARAVFAASSRGMSIGLSGALGSGKTTFVRHFSAAAGASPADVSSPSYVLAQEYPAANLTIEHWDLYRLFSAPEELLEPPAPEVIRLIEWPERGGLEGALDLLLRFEFDDIRLRPSARRAALEGAAAERVQALLQ